MKGSLELKDGGLASGSRIDRMAIIIAMLKLIRRQLVPAHQYFFEAPHFFLVDDVQLSAFDLVVAEISLLSTPPE